MKSKATIRSELQPYGQIAVDAAPAITVDEPGWGFGRGFIGKNIAAEERGVVQDDVHHQLNDDPVTRDNAQPSTFATGKLHKPVNGATFGLFAFVAMGFAVLYWMFIRTPPSARAAADEMEHQRATSQAIVEQFLTVRQGEIRAMRLVLNGTPKLVSQFRNYTKIPQIPLQDLRANPFQFKSLHPTAPVDTTLPTERIRKEQERAAALAAVKSLQLQSIMMGSHCACMINGKLLQESQPAGSFVIEKISANSVIVRCGIYRFELRMTH